MVGFQKEANYKETAGRGTMAVPLLLISPLPNWRRGRASFPRKSQDFLGTPVSALRGGGMRA